MEYKVLAQSFTGNKRIAKIVNANNEASVLRAVSSELDAAGFYVVSIVRV